jgi:hypothetical protein
MPHTDSIELVGSIVGARMAGIGAERCAGPMWRPSERWRSGGWDGEFESPLLQRRVRCEPDFLDRGAEYIAERDSVTVPKR